MTIADAGYRIAEVAARTGFSAPTLRYYEEIGLLPPPSRTASGYRVYDGRAIERLTFIARAKRLGATLDEITDLATAWDRDDCGPVKHRLRGLVDAKLADTSARMADLRAFADDLRRTASALESLPLDGPCDERCGCVTDAAVVDPPIACLLEASDVPTRVAEWKTLLSGSVHRAPIDGGLRITFGSDAPLTELARLVDAEYDCCGFFSFTITVDRRGVALEVTAPADGAALVDELFGLGSGFGSPG